MKAIPGFFFIVSLVSCSAFAELDLRFDVNTLGKQAVSREKSASAPGFDFTPRKQRKIADELVRQLRRGNNLVNIPEVETYINELGAKLARVSGYPVSSFRFFVLNRNEVNAFAGFGGIIGINKGTILRARSESELASVIAHEIAHITQRHLDRQAEVFNSPGNIITQALILALAVAAGTKDPEAGMAAAATAQGINIQRGINFTRRHEKEADRIGLKILHAAGFNPNGMTGFMKQLLQMQRFSASSIPSYLQTHPLTVDRVAEAQQKARQMSTKGKITNTVSFNVIKRMLSSGSRGNSGEAKIKKAFSYLRLGKREKALQTVNNVRGNNLYLNLYLGRFYKDAGLNSKALKLFRKAYRNNPANMAAAKLLGESLLAAGNHAEADKVLTNSIRYNHNNPELNRLKAKLLAKQGKNAEAYLWQARHEFYSGNTRRALEQLNIARRLAKKSFYLAAKIDEEINKYQVVHSLEK